MEGSRRTRDAVATRAAILDAARDIFLTDGFERSSIRRIASRAGCSHGTLYLYFRDKDDLLYQLIEEQFRPLQAQLRAIPRTIDPVSRLREAALATLRTGLEYPDHFHLMMSSTPPHAVESDPRLGPFASELSGVLADIIVRAVTRGQLRSDVTISDALAMLAAIHGVIELCRARVLDSANAESVATLAIERILAGMRR